jgi:hypothetical protein
MPPSLVLIVSPSRSINEWQHMDGEQPGDCQMCEEPQNSLYTVEPVEI